MRKLLTKMGLFVVEYLLINEQVHNAIRNAAKKTTNKYDDAAVEAFLKFMVDLYNSLRDMK